MKNRIAAATLAALAVTATPVLAQVAAQSAPVRASSVSAEDSEAAGGTGIIIGVLAAAAIIGGIVIAADGDEPNSP